MTTSGWVKSTTTSAPASSTSIGSSASTRGDQLEVVGRLDRLAHLGAHPPAGAEHADPDHGRPVT